jgi:hypothetical protein
MSGIVFMRNCSDAANTGVGAATRAISQDFMKSRKYQKKKTLSIQNPLSKQFTKLVLEQHRPFLGLTERNHAAISKAP